MKVIAFAGPSLTAADRAANRDIDWRPPAEAGDMLRLIAEGGGDRIVCLIDGYFDHRPAVRHKELLLLLSRGTRLFGAASIGALRAVEMRGCGMIGVGAVFAAYARGSLTGDDEVALIHGGAQSGWRPLSVPLVDVRATLSVARHALIVARRDARDMLRAAAATHYVDRQWPEICGAVADPERRAAFEAWLRTGAVSQKRTDALACLAAARAPTNPMPARPDMIWTCYVDSLARDCAVDLSLMR